MSIVRSRSTRRVAGPAPSLPAVAALLFAQLVGCAGIVALADPLASAPQGATESLADSVGSPSDEIDQSQEVEPSPLDARELRQAARHRGSRYQVAAARTSSGWVILDTETGKFEHWVPVAGTSRYHVFGCRFEGGCSIFDKRSVDRGLDP